MLLAMATQKTPAAPYLVSFSSCRLQKCGRLWWLMGLASAGLPQTTRLVCSARHKCLVLAQALLTPGCQGGMPWQVRRKRPAGTRFVSKQTGNDLAASERPLTLKARRDAWRQWPTPARPRHFSCQQANNSIQIQSIGTSSSCRLHLLSEIHST